MKKKVYIETTVVSYLTGRMSTNRVLAGHQDTTRRFWQQLEKYDVYLSDLVWREAGRGDPEQAKARRAALIGLTMLEADQEAKKLAEMLIAKAAVPANHPDDAMHIAVATVNGIDFLVTWNFSHINNPVDKMKIRRVVENAGYVSPEMCSPEELIRGDI